MVNGDTRSINAATLVLEDGQGNALPYRMHWGYSSHVIRVAPKRGFQTGGSYRLRLTTGVRDKDGAALAKDTVIAFTVAAAADEAAD